MTRDIYGHYQINNIQKAYQRIMQMTPQEKICYQKLLKTFLEV